MQKNHLSGLQQSLLRVIFWNSQQLMEVRREMQPIIRRNKNKANVNDAYKAFGPQRSTNTVKLQVGHQASTVLITCPLGNNQQCEILG